MNQYIAEKAASVLNVSLSEVEINSKFVEEADAWYCWDSSRGGKSCLIDEDGGYLVAASAVNFEELVSEFNAGRRS